MDTACLVCGNALWEPHFRTLARCRACGFVTAGPEAAGVAGDARDLYRGDYFTGGEYLDYAGDEAFFRRNFRRRLEEVLARRRGGLLVEIGAAYGFFLDLARAHFRTVGFEVNAEAIRHARRRLGLDVRGDDFLDATRESIGGPVDVLVMWDVIEHLDRPDAFLIKAAELAAPGGLLFITTGDIGSLLARLRGRRWRMIHPPTHLHYFDRRTMTRLLERCGFEVLEIRSTGVARSVRQILYSVLALKLRLNFAWRAAAAVTPASWGLTLNSGDIMLVIARRRDGENPPGACGRGGRTAATGGL